VKTRPLSQIVSTATLSVLTIANTVLASPGAGTIQHGMPEGRLAQSQRLPLARKNVTRIFDDAGGPRIRTEDGQEFTLDPLPAELKKQLAENAAKIDNTAQATADAPSVGSPLTNVLTNVDTLKVLALLSADHRAYYGPIRSQGGRGTCVSFSTAAAIEGMYRRRDAGRYANLDLSEQWANHLQKMVSLAANGAGVVNWRENQLGSWGGSACQYLIRVEQKYGLPEEGAMAYNGDGDYGPKPATDPNFVLQRTTDDFNLDAAVLPQTALGRAPYRPTGWVNLSNTEARNTDTVVGLIRDGRDVVIDMALVTPEDRTASGAWTPGKKPNGADPDVRGGHSMLFIGYSEAGRYFICRNSWGYDATDAGYTRVSYDYVAKYAYNGLYVTSVAEPSTETSMGRLYIGRWKMNHDGWQGTLDIYRLPGLYNSAELSGQADYRIGTYYDGQGNAFRINGYLYGSDLVFYINFNHQVYNGSMALWNVGMPYGKLEGTRYVAQIFSWDDQNMAGFEVQDGVTYGFHATKQSTPWHVAAPASSNPRDAFLGTWKMNHDGWKGSLSLSTAATGWYQDGSGNWYTTGAGNAVGGWYKDSDGASHSVVGAVFGRELKFYVWFGWWQPFDGYVYSWDKGLMSGACYWNGLDFGFTAARQGN
jgi:hypothetical protein